MNWTDSQTSEVAWSSCDRDPSQNRTDGDASNHAAFSGLTTILETSNLETSNDLDPCGLTPMEVVEVEQI